MVAQQMVGIAIESATPTIHLIMLKKDLIAEVALDTGIPQHTVRAVMDSISRVTLGAVRRGREVMVLGLGKISTSQRGPKKARNIHTGESVVVPPRTVPLFRPSVSLSKAASRE